MAQDRNGFVRKSLERGGNNTGQQFCCTHDFLSFLYISSIINTFYSALGTGNTTHSSFWIMNSCQTANPKSRSAACSALLQKPPNLAVMVEARETKLGASIDQIPAGHLLPSLRSWLCHGWWDFSAGKWSSSAGFCSWPDPYRVGKTLIQGLN